MPALALWAGGTRKKCAAVLREFVRVGVGFRVSASERFVNYELVRNCCGFVRNAADSCGMLRIRSESCGFVRNCCGFVRNRVECCGIDLNLCGM